MNEGLVKAGLSRLAMSMGLNATQPGGDGTPSAGSGSSSGPPASTPSQTPSTSTSTGNSSRYTRGCRDGEFVGFDTFEALSSTRALGVLVIAYGAAQVPYLRQLTGSLMPDGLNLTDVFRALFEQWKIVIPPNFFPPGQTQLATPFVNSGTLVQLQPPPGTNGQVISHLLGFDTAISQGGAGVYEWTFMSQTKEQGTNGVPTVLGQVPYEVTRGEFGGFSTSMLWLFNQLDALQFERQAAPGLIDRAYFPGPSAEGVGPFATANVPTTAQYRLFLPFKDYPVIQAGSAVHRAWEGAGLNRASSDQMRRFLGRAEVIAFAQAISSGMPCYMSAQQVCGLAGAYGL